MKTFAQIVPRWSNFLKNLTSRRKITGKGEVRGKNLDINSFPFCVVGEAHKFKGLYRHTNKRGVCKQCNKLSMRFLEHMGHKKEDAFSFITSPFDEKKLEQTKVAFVKHWNKVHVVNK